MRRVDWLVTGLNVLGGAETYVRQVVPLLRKLGWDLRVLTFTRGGILVDELRLEGVPIVELGARHKADLGTAGRLARLWRTGPPDIVHTHLYHAGLLGRAVAKALGIQRVVVHQHGPEGARSPMRTLLDRATSAWVSRYVASCQAVAQGLQQREGIPAGRISVIYYGLDASAFNPEQSRPELPGGWPLPGGARSLVCVGRLSREKGQHLLLEALAALPPGYSDVHAVFLGEGRTRAGLAEQSRRLGLEGRVHMPGSRRDILDWLPHFDLFALPSEWEGVSLALLEAMAAGLPVVATRAGGTPEVVLDGETGLLVSPGDVGALAAALSRLLADSSLRTSLGRAGQQRAREQFSLAETARQIVQLYVELLGEKSPMH